ncbi:hypothetical protein E6O75_ATG07808 [Venturia nashicola]|uniref:Uncharacterized protein n=1 Tax=Venturia nashicola TaxID=86259 RepID=A0A4Z1P440_9PEZI|nr:hypothetical protein E6O75_ATG07808 [Venturia nashicola]
MSPTTKELIHRHVLKYEWRSHFETIIPSVDRDFVQGLDTFRKEALIKPKKPQELPRAQQIMQPNLSPVPGVLAPGPVLVNSPVLQFGVKRRYLFVQVGIDESFLLPESAP